MTVHASFVLEKFAAMDTLVYVGRHFRMDQFAEFGGLQKCLNLAILFSEIF